MSAAGDIDYYFNPPYIDEPVMAVAVDSKTNIWIGGGFQTVGNQSIFSLAVLNPDGSVNANNNFNLGQVSFGYVVSIAVDNQDNVYVAYRGYYGGAGVLRLVPQGGLNGYSGWVYDQAYSTNITSHIGGVNSIAWTAPGPSNLPMTSPNELYVAGTIKNGTNTYAMGVFDLNGNIQPSFGVNFANNGGLLGSNPTVQQVKYLSAGSAIINGQQYQWPDGLLIAGSFGVAKVSSGGFVTSVYPDNQYTCCAERQHLDELTCPSPAGEILAGGQNEPYVSYGTGFNYGPYLGLEMERLGATNSKAYFPPINGSANYPTDNGSFISQIIALPDGDALVGGYISSIRGTGVRNFAHLLPDGTVDTSFANGTDIAILDMARQPDGNYIIAGVGQYDNEGALERRTDFPQSGISFDSQPQPAAQTVYQGDSVSIVAGVTSWPGISAQWTHNGTNVPTQTNTAIFLSNTTTNDSGTYQLSVQTFAFCPASALSSNASLTVLPAPSAPANDQFASAIPLQGLNVTGTGTVRSATFEPGENNSIVSYGQGSVWWTWTAPYSGLANVDVSRCDFSAAIGIYTGSNVAGLAVVTNNYDYGNNCECSGPLTNFSFTVNAGTTYHIAIVGQPPVGGLGNILFSIKPGGNAWLNTNSGTNSSLRAVASGNGRIVAVGSGGTILTSTDGAHWTAPASPVTDNLWGLAVGNGQFVATGDNGDILTSPDGLNWTMQSSGITGSIWGIAYGKGMFLAVADYDVTLTSTNGTVWTQDTTGTDESLQDVAFANNQFIIGLAYSGLVVSSDAVNWNATSINAYDYLYSVAYGNNQYVGVGNYGNVIVSTDATNWNLATNVSTLYGLTYANGRFVGVGVNGALEISKDGTNWVQDNSGTANSLYGAASYQASQFVAVGDNGTILVSQLPQIGPFMRNPQSGAVEFSLTGLSGSTAVIESSTTLSPPNWQPIATNQIVNSTALFLRYQFWTGEILSCCCAVESWLTLYTKLAYNLFLRLQAGIHF